MRQEAADALVVALDVGTSGVRAVLVDATGTPRAEAYREVLPAYPAPGLVEHDPEALWRATLAVLGAVLAGVPAERVRGLGIATQRGTALVWEAATGRAAAPGLSWQDGRTAARCNALMAEGVLVSPLAAATKIEWILDRVDADRAGVRSGRLRCGTVDAWLAGRLTAGRVFATDASNASCSGFYDLLTRNWSAAILEALRVPASALPAIVDSSAVLGRLDAPGVPPIPLAALIGDQQAAMMGQLRLAAGEVKITYGTSAMLDLNAGAEPLWSTCGRCSRASPGAAARCTTRSAPTSPTRLPSRCAPTGARRRTTSSSSSRRTPSAFPSSARPSSRRARSAPRGWPGSPPACGEGRTTSARAGGASGCSTRGSARRSARSASPPGGAT